MAELDIAALVALYADNTAGDISAADFRAGNTAWHHDTDTGQVTGDYFVCAAHGDDTNAGTNEAPFLTIQKAANTVAAGETVYVRGGLYNEEIDMNANGTAGSLIYFLAYPGETPIVDGTGFSPSNTHLWRVDGDYYEIDGFVLQNLEDNGTGNAAMRIAGTGIRVRNCLAQRNEGTGFQFVNTGTIVLEDCVSRYNYTPADSGESADGFTSGGGTVDYTLVRCLAYRNGDDGYDWFTSVSGSTFIDCLAIENGYNEDGTHPSAGDGIGFKQGVGSVGGGHTFINCVAEGNYNYGFEGGVSSVSSTWVNCTGKDSVNGPNFRMALGVDNELYGCVSINPGSADVFTDDTIQMHCSWADTKSTTGDPAITHEGYVYINTFDNKVQMYADGAWRTLADGW